MHRMNAIGKFISNFRDFYNEINAATLTGAIDVVVVEQPDGSFTCSPFHVRFGKLGVLRSREKVVDIEINGESLDIHMKLGESGEAFFVEEVAPGELGEDEFIPPHLACSPIPHDDSYLARYHSSPITDPLSIAEICEGNISFSQDRPFDKEMQVPENIPGFVLNELTEEQMYKWTPQKNEDASSQTYSYLKNINSLNANDLTSQDLLLNSVAFDNSGTFNNESVLAKDGSDVQLSSARTDSSSQSVPKTFRAETLDDDPKSSDKVRKISIVTGEFRPISLESVDAPIHSVIHQKSSEDLNATSNRDDNGALETSSSSGSILARKDSYKENAMPIDGSIKSINSNSGKRKKRRKSVMKKKAGQKKNNGGGSSSQTEQSELSEAGSNVGKESIKDSVAKENLDEKELAVFQMDDVKDDAVSLQGISCSHMIGAIENKTCEVCQQTPKITVSSVETIVTVTETMRATNADNLVELARIQHASTETDFHFFSDTEITPGCTPPDSRPCSPVQSDTEFEMKRQSKAVGTDDDGTGKSIHGQMQQSWRWGELPSPPPRPILTAQASRNVMKLETTEPVPPLSSDEEVNKQQQEVPPETLHYEEDAESGNGTSLPQSPHSVEGAIGGPKSLDSDFEEPKHSVFEKKSYGEISMSLCGGLAENGPSEDTFLQNIVTYGDLVQDPKLIDNPNLVVRFNGKYLNWRTVCPMVMSLVVFQKSLPQEVIESLSSEYMPLKKGQKKDVKQSGYSSWFSWRRVSEPKKAGTGDEEPSSPECDKSGELKEVVATTPETPDTPDVETSSQVETKPVLESVDSIEEELICTTALIEDQAAALVHEETGIATQTSFPGTPLLTDAQKDAKEEGYSGSNSSDESDGGRTKPQGIKLPMEKRSYYEHTEKYRKTLRLSSDQISSLNLRDGGNEVVFSVTTAYQGTTRCKCHIYRWRHDDKVVISDIDGTITKSDVLGHILPIVGKDWAQSGVAQLFTKIKNNGYKLLYLSARAIGQARVTREYLRSIKQGDLSLPDGPLLLNPTSLISAFHREVIEKKPEEFKISCLRDIQALFPENSKPFYAGYGNRINDVWAYRAVGIPIFRIFTINHRGELKHELTQTFQSSYSNMSYIVDQMFPPPPEDTSEDFSNFIYWRDPIPEIVVDSLVSEVQVTTTIIEQSQSKAISAGSGH